MRVIQLVAGTTLQTLKVTILDEDGNPRNINGGAVRLKAHSQDLPSIDIDQAGTIFDGPGGVAQWVQFGNFVTVANLGGLDLARYTCEVMLTLGGLVGRTFVDERFEIHYYKPLVT